MCRRNINQAIFTAIRSVHYHTMTMDLFIFVNIFFRTEERREAGTIANYQNFTMIPVLKKTLKKTVILNINNFFCGYISLS